MFYRHFDKLMFTVNFNAQWLEETKVWSDVRCKLSLTILTCLSIFTIIHIAFFLYFVTDSVKCLALWLFKTDMSSHFLKQNIKNSKCETREYEYKMTFFHSRLLLIFLSYPRVSYIKISMVRWQLSLLDPDNIKYQYLSIMIYY